MPTYDYYCDANGRTVEVSHHINESIGSWGELCEQAGIGSGETPADAPVRRLISGGAVVSRASLSNPEPACGSGACCPSGVCGFPK
jgi:predicted nucleic acid-binding Zn ribbon protein